MSQAKIFRRRLDAPINPTYIKIWVWVHFMGVFLNHQRPTKHCICKDTPDVFPLLCQMTVAVPLLLCCPGSIRVDQRLSVCECRVMSWCTGLELVSCGKGNLVDSVSIGSWDGVLTESCKLITILFELIHIIKSEMLLFERVLLWCCTNSWECNPN